MTRNVRNRASKVQAAGDSLTWALALIFATALRYDLTLSAKTFPGFVVIIPLAVLGNLVAGLADGLYMGRSRYGTFEDVAAMVRSAVIVTIFVYCLNMWLAGRPILPRGAVIIAGGLAILGMGALRYGWRLFPEHRHRASNGAAERVLIFGAGDGAAQAVAAMRRDPARSYIPVALLDDDPAKANFKVMGVPVVGSRSAVTAATNRFKPTTLLIAIPSANGPLIRDLTEAGRNLGLTVRVLPSVKELFGSSIDVTDIHEVNEADLLGRRRIDTDVQSIAHYLKGRRVLVTGAGGSIGSELCRQIHRFEPAELIMLDRDESALHSLQLSIEGRALLDSPHLVLLDIRDRDRVYELFRQRPPDVVFHAAALKHLTLLEKNPGEAIKTNVFGTLHLLQIAADCGVKRFVNISTDKAADPTSVLGTSKRIAERLTAWYAYTTGHTFLSVRFGNVLGSRGSVLSTFQAQIANGGPITVSSPDVTRYFMTVQEAVELVVQAGAIGRPGEVLVLDMGKPTRIADIALTLIARAGGNIEVTYTGLRHGEKVQEVLFGEGECDLRPIHPLISHVPVPALDPVALDALVSIHSQTTEALAALSNCASAAPSEHPDTIGPTVEHSNEPTILRIPHE